MLSKYIYTFFIFLFFSTTLFAIDGDIRVFIKPNQSVYTSQKVIVSVEVLTDAFSISDTRIRFLNSNNYIVQSPISASYVNTEVVNDEDWQIVHYDYEVYPLKGGTVTIAPLSINFSASMGYGQAKKEFALRSDSITFHVNTIHGVKENQFVLVTDAYSLTRTMKPEKKQLIVGDAVEMFVEQKAHNIPDILLRPIEYKSNALLRVYKKEPKLKNELKGKYNVSRKDTFTFVASAEGNVTLPKKKTLCWNPLSQKLEVNTLAEIEFEILPDPQIALDIKDAQIKKRLVYSISLLFVVLILYKVFSFKVRDYFYKRQEVYLASEAGKYTMLLECIKEDEVSNIYKQMYIWLLSISIKFSSGGFNEIIKIQASFEISLQELENKLLDSSQKFDKVKFTKELGKLRVTLLEQSNSKTRGLVLSINPN